MCMRRALRRFSSATYLRVENSRMQMYAQGGRGYNPDGLQFFFFFFFFEQLISA